MIALFTAGFLIRPLEGDGCPRSDRRAGTGGGASALRGSM
jgi:hypothetical protein